MGDPRNYDPNDDEPFDYARFSPTWGDAQPQNPYAPPPPAATTPTGTTGAPPPATTGGGKTPQQIEAEGREYDRQHGYIGGYMAGGVWVNGSPSSGGRIDPLPGPNPTTGAGATGDGPDYGNLLPFSPYREMSPFSYGDFTPSSYEGLEKQPGFAEGQQRLQKQIEAGAAYKGMLRSGMTLGDLWTGLDTNKQQRFAEYDSRRFRDWNANFGKEKDTYGFGANENQNFNNYRFNTEKASFDDALERWKQQVQSLTQITTAGAT